MRKYERIRCGTNFKHLLDELNAAHPHKLSYPEVTDGLAIFLEDRGLARELRQRRKNNRRGGFL